MPIPGARYRWKDGVRLAFVDNKVVEVKKKGGRAKRVDRDREEREAQRRALER